MKRRIILLLALTCLLLCTTAGALETRAQKTNLTLSFSGTTATCKLEVFGGSSDKIEATMELWQGTTFIDSWTSTDTEWLSMKETHSVSKGKTYTLKASGTVGGKSFTANPINKTCN